MNTNADKLTYFSIGEKNPMKTKPWMMLVAIMAGWINRQQQDALCPNLNKACPAGN
jgi:hypothetical protein